MVMPERLKDERSHGRLDSNPELLEADKDAEYAAVIEIDLNEIKEPLLACPNDPDDIKPLSEVANTKIDEVFIGSCMTNIGHFRAAGHLLKKYNLFPPDFGLYHQLKWISIN